MNFSKTTLKNGLRVVCVPIEGMESATVTVWVGVGSRQEEDRIAGLSHFIEHMAFKGSKKRPTAKEIAETIDAMGGINNASTSKEWTNFYIKARASNLETMIDVLSDIAMNPLYNPNEIEKEKGVITEEISMYEDTPMMIIGDIFERLIYRGTPLGRDVIGTKNTVKNMSRNDFVKYKEKYYTGSNILVTVSGGVDSAKTRRLTEKYFSHLPKGKIEKIEKYKSDQEGSRLLLKTKSIEQAHFIIGFLGNPYGHEDKYKEALLAAILGGGMSSRLFSEIREKRGLAYAVQTSTDHYVDVGYLATYIGADVKRIDDAIKVVLDQSYGLANKKYPISEKELKKAKEQIKGNLALALEDTQKVNGFVGIKELMGKKIETPEEIYKKVDEVGVDEIYAVAKKFFTQNRLNLAIIGPYKDKGKFEKLINS